MRKLILPIIIYTLISCEPTTSQIDKKKIEEEVWNVIETRFVSWKDNDIEKYMQTQHPDWKRWSTDTNELVNNEDYRNQWERAKNNEEVLEMELDLAEIIILGQGDAALVHFISNEKFKWIGSESNSGRQPGDVYDDAILRWSEFLVKENGKWLCIGGHRDLSRPEKRPTKIN